MADKVREFPALFNTEMVRALLRAVDPKTQTRRPVVPQPPPGTVMKEHSKVPGLWLPYTPDGRLRNDVQGTRKDDCGFYCPYPKGSRLWVRETWALRRDGRQALHKEGYQVLVKALGLPDFHIKWRPSIHMPRWASRIFLQVTATGMQRLQDISELDAQAEGVNQLPYVYYCGAFQRLWDSIYAKRGFSWDDNPYVWVYVFERVPRTEEEKWQCPAPESPA